MILVGDRIREARVKLNLSQEELGEKIGVTKVSVSGYEKGTKNPKLNVFVKLVNTLDLTPDQLLNHDINVMCEEEIPYTFKISKKEMRLIKELRKNEDEYKKLLKKFEIE